MFVVAILLLCFAVLNAAQVTTASEEAPVAAEGIVPLIWAQPMTLPTKQCNGINSRDCQRSSPVLEDINQDGYLDIVVATNSGHVLVVEHNGHILWDRDVSPYFGMSANSQEINSTPAVADIDADGMLEIVVGAGTLNPEVCTQGGMIALSHTGQVEPGWPQMAQDWDIPPPGCRDSIYSSPAVGDMDNDGDLEIVVGGFDTSIYAWHHDGTLLPGYPPDSWLYLRLGWSILRGHLADTVWSSPGLADLDQDGFLDLVLGTDEGNQGGGWVCPYRLPPGWRAGYCGGSVYVLDRFGGLLPGWPQHFLEAIQSTVAIADLNEDAVPDLIIGKGTFYRNKSPDHPTYAFVLHVKDNEGHDLPGWQGGKQVGGPIAAAPSVGDIAGDSGPEIVVASSEEGRLYAWHANGQPVAGFPMTPLDLFGGRSLGFNFGQTTLLADTDGDGKMEILLNQDWIVSIVDGDGSQITASAYPSDPRPVYYAEGSLLNSPAVGDLDNDGKLELVANNGELYAWRLSDSVDEADWPMFKSNAAGNPTAPMRARMAIANEQLIIFKDSSEPGAAEATFLIRNLGDESLDWLVASAPAGVTFSPGSGVIAGHSEQVVEVMVDRAVLAPGMNPLGNIRIVGSSDGETVLGSPVDISLTVYFGDVKRLLLPAVDY